ncbi:MAG: CtsR family transcriptional regulator [Alicyclobacillus sp.]|nr:CtsR family transcriptional regulator [Alicyclobacillus sp.]
MSVKVKVKYSQCQSQELLSNLTVLDCINEGGSALARNISDIIEQYIKDMLRQSESGVAELQRSELAEQFQCVPSQINYVISTRFSIEQGYIVESKRGGGGYIRIRELQYESHKPLVRLLEAIGEQLSQREAEGLIAQMYRNGQITSREAAMLRAAVNRDVLRMDLPLRDMFRARLLAQMLVALFSDETENDKDDS